MKIINLFIIFLLVLAVCVARKEIDIIRLTNCPEYKNLTATYQNVVFKRDKNGKPVSVRFDLIVTKEVKRPMAIVTLKKCVTENLDSCEYYMKDFKVNHFCEIIGQQNQIWSDALFNSNFPKSCPIPAETYKLNDTKFDSNLQLTLLPVPIALWKINIFTHDAQNGNIMIGCTYLEVKVYSTRRN